MALSCLAAGSGCRRLDEPRAKSSVAIGPPILFTIHVERRLPGRAGYDRRHRLPTRDKLNDEDFTMSLEKPEAGEATVHGRASR
jgi:hypothetical protein